MIWDTDKDRKRRKLIEQQCELKNKLNYMMTLTDEERASIQMQIDSLQRRIDASTGNEDIFSPKYANVQGNGADIFSPEKNDLTKEQIKEILDGGFDSGVPRPVNPEPCYTYYRYNKASKKR